MPNKQEREMDNIVLSLRLTGNETARFWRVMDAAKARNPYAGRSDIIRELIGLTPASALTPEEIAYFRKGKQTNVKATNEKVVLLNDKGQVGVAHDRSNRRKIK